MKQTSSTRKLNEEARSRIASILLTEVSDPRLSLITVTGCEVAVDRSLCKVYVSCDSDRYDEVKKGLESAKKRVRHLLGQGLGWRLTPELVFIIDTTVDEAERITIALQNVPPTMAIPKDEDGNPIPIDEDAGSNDEASKDAPLEDAADEGTEA